MDFGALPPEITSSLIYSGPGTGPLLEAAESWDSLSTALAEGHSMSVSVLGDLAGVWSGPSAASMQASTGRYLSWIAKTAAQAELSANQARSAAAAYGAARAATVPPSVVALNRTMLATLVATNVLGQNTPAIAANEAEYAEFWAADAAAMYAYVGASSAATSALPQFTAAPNTANPVTPQTVQPAATTSITSILDSLFGNGTTLGQNWQALVSSGSFTQLPADMLMGVMALLTADTVVVEQQAMAGITERPPMIPPPNPGRIAPPIRGAAVAYPRAASRVGGLSVPPSWAAPREAPLSVVVNPAEQGFQSGIPVPPAVPVVTAGRSSQKRMREDPEYGAVSKILPARHPSAG